MAKQPNDDMAEKSASSPSGTTPAESHSPDPSFEDIMAEYRYRDVTKHNANGKPLLSALLDSRPVPAVSEDTEGFPVMPAPPANLSLDTSVDGQSPLQKADLPEPPPAKPSPPPLAQQDTDGSSGIFRDIARSLSTVNNPEAAPAADDDPEDTKDFLKAYPPVPPYEQKDKVRTEEVPLGSNPRFDQFFAPKNTYVGDDTDGESEDTIENDDTRAPLQRWFRSRTDKQSQTLEEACEGAKKEAVSLRFRTLFAFICLVPMLLISTTQTLGILPGFLRYSEKPFTVLSLLVLFMALTILCGIDRLAKGVSDLFLLRPGAETLVFMSCTASLVHVFTIADPFSLFSQSPSIAFLPYCALSSTAVFFCLWGHYHRIQAYHRTYKTAILAESGAESDAVVLEEKLWDGDPGFGRHNAPANDFVAMCERTDIVTKVSRFVTPLLIILSFVLTGLSSAKHENAVYTFWIFSALSCAAIPLTSFGAFTMVFSRMAARLSHMGAALMGWTAASEMSRANVIVIKDGDLFPPGSLHINGLRIFPPFTYEQVVSYATSLLSEPGSALYFALQSATSDQPLAPMKVNDFEAFEGGISGEIDGRRIHLGTLNFMNSMAIHIPADHNFKNVVYITVNLAVAGIFAVVYSPVKQVEGALLLLEQQKIQTVLAVRDFNIMPTMLKEKYGIDPDILEFPIIEDRFSLSSPERDYIGRPSAVLSRDGLCPYAEAIVGGKRLHKTTLINLIIHLIAQVLGVLIVFYFTHQTAPGAAMAISPLNLLLFMFMWWLIQWIVSVFSHRY